MAFNFPTPSAVGEVFTPLPGLNYVWDGTLWNTVPGPSFTAFPFNYIVNPSMLISQEYVNGVVTTHGHFPADQMQFYCAPMNMSAARVQVASANGSANRLRFTVTTAKPTLAAGEWNHVPVQYLEGRRVAAFMWGSTRAIQAILRFTFKASVTGTFAVGIRNSDVTRGYTMPIVVTAANTDKEYIFAIPGDQTGTWLNDSGVGMSITWATHCSPEYNTAPYIWTDGNLHGVTGMTNGLTTNGSTFEVADIGFYLDPFKTNVPPRWEANGEAYDLAECQRYWWPCRALKNGVADTGTHIARARATCPVPMRVVPSYSIGAIPAGVEAPYMWDAAYQRFMIGGGNISSHYCLEIDCNCGAIMASGRPGQQLNEYPGYLAISARM